MAVIIPAWGGSKSIEQPRNADTLRSHSIGENQLAWRQLHEKYYPMAHAFLGRMGVDPLEVEDVCQDVFLQVFRYLDRFEQRADFKTWLYKVCISQASRSRRRAGLAKRLRRLMGQQVHLKMVADPHTWNEDEVQRRVHKALTAMKEIHRRVFVLFELEGLSGKEISRIMNLPTASLRRRLHHARTEFSALIEEGTPSCR